MVATHLGLGALGTADIAAVILHRQLTFLSQFEDAVEPHRHSGIFAPLVSLAGIGEEFFVFLVIHVDAEHMVSCFSKIITLGKALTGEGSLQLLHVLFRHRLPIEDRAVDSCDHRHILGSLHAAFDLQASDTHGFEFLQVLHKAVVL